MIYDAAIIGTGPAGVSAALNLKIREKNFIWLGSASLSDKVSRAERISNYPGFIDATGEQLAAAFRAQVDAMGIAITEAMVNVIYPMEGRYALSAGADFYEARTLILATGVAAKNALRGEAERVGRGVSYCATCDGGLYRGRKIAVICGNRRFEPEVAYLAGLAEQVWFFPTYPNPGRIADNVRQLPSVPVEVIGEDRVCGLMLSNEAILPLDGVFCLRDSIALNTLLPGLELEDGHIAVDRAMATNLPGCFAAGDCTGRPYQYAKAVGEGNIAAHSAVEYLAKLA